MTTPLLLTHSYIQAPINSCLECCWSLLTCLPSFIFVLYSVFSAQLPQWSFQNIRQFMLPTLLRTLLPALKSEMIWLHYFSYLICYYSLLPHCFLQPSCSIHRSVFSFSFPGIIVKYEGWTILGKVLFYFSFSFSPFLFLWQWYEVKDREKKKATRYKHLKQERGGHSGRMKGFGILSL